MESSAIGPATPKPLRSSRVDQGLGLSSRVQAAAFKTILSQSDVLAAWNQLPGLNEKADEWRRIGGIVDGLSGRNKERWDELRRHICQDVSFVEYFVSGNSHKDLARLWEEMGEAPNLQNSAASLQSGIRRAHYERNPTIACLIRSDQLWNWLIDLPPIELEQVLRFSARIWPPLNWQVCPAGLVESRRDLFLKNCPKDFFSGPLSVMPESVIKPDKIARFGTPWCQGLVSFWTSYPGRAAAWFRSLEQWADIEFILLHMHKDNSGTEPFDGEEAHPIRRYLLRYGVDHLRAHIFSQLFPTYCDRILNSSIACWQSDCFTVALPFVISKSQHKGLLQELIPDQYRHGQALAPPEPASEDRVEIRSSSGTLAIVDATREERLSTARLAPAQSLDCSDSKRLENHIKQLFMSWPGDYRDLIATIIALASTTPSDSLLIGSQVAVEGASAFRPSVVAYLLALLPYQLCAQALQDEDYSLDTKHLLLLSPCEEIGKLDRGKLQLLKKQLEAILFHWPEGEVPLMRLLLNLQNLGKLQVGDVVQFFMLLSQRQQQSVVRAPWSRDETDLFVLAPFLNPKRLRSKSYPNLLWYALEQFNPGIKEAFLDLLRTAGSVERLPKEKRPLATSDPSVQAVDDLDEQFLDSVPFALRSFGAPHRALRYSSVTLHDLLRSAAALIRGEDLNSFDQMWSNHVERWLRLMRLDLLRYAPLHLLEDLYPAQTWLRIEDIQPKWTLVLPTSSGSKRIIFNAFSNHSKISPAVCEQGGAHWTVLSDASFWPPRTELQESAELRAFFGPVALSAKGPLLNWNEVVAALDRRSQQDSFLQRLWNFRAWVLLQTGVDLTLFEGVLRRLCIAMFGEPVDPLQGAAAWLEERLVQLALSRGLLPQAYVIPYTPQLQMGSGPLFVEEPPIH